MTWPPDGWEAMPGGGLRQIESSTPTATTTMSTTIATTVAKSSPVISGGTFALDVPAETEAVWGLGASVLWSAGEPVMVVGPQGVGKTTIAQRLMLGRVGLGVETPLGLPIVKTDRPVLYVAADRPAQARRSIRRMVTEAEREALDERVLFYPGPPPFDLGRDPEGFADFALQHSPSTLIIDSLKDAAVGLSEDEIGSRVNRGLQLLVREGVEVLVLHHQRKATADNRRPRTLSDVYGSTWITAGTGSVVLLWGSAGDPVLELVHLKQPAEEVGPLRIIIDHDLGEVRLYEEADPLTLLKRAPQGLTALDLARVMFGDSKPSDAQIEKARRKLKRLEREGLAHVQAVTVP